MTVGDELAGSGTRGSKPQAEDHVVQARLAELEEDITRLALLGFRTLEEDAELTLEHAVDVLRLLLFAELDAILGEFAPAVLPMLTGSEIATLEHLVGPVDRLAETTGDFGTRTSIPSHD